VLITLEPVLCNRQLIRTGLRHKERYKRASKPVRKLLRRMVGPCGLEPQTSTVSIQKARMTVIDRSGHKCPSAFGLALEAAESSRPAVDMRRQDFPWVPRQGYVTNHVTK
jgi:hypothetical protein